MRLTVAADPDPARRASPPRRVGLVVALLMMPVGLFGESALAGSVLYVTAADAYLDAGRTDGLVVGQQLAIRRGKRTVGTCEVRQVASNQALCQGERLRTGDQFVLPRGTTAAVATASTDKPKVKPRQPVPSASELEERRVVAAQIPIEKVVFAASSSPVDVQANARLRQQVWTTSTTPAGVFAPASLDASMRATFGPASAAAALRLVGNLYSPADQRFRPDDVLELYVWNVSAAIAAGPVVGEVGRFAARKVAGTLVLDGAQVGARFFDDTTEVGVYAGAIPDLLTLAPSVDRLTAGSYVGVDLPLGEQFLLLPRLRAGAVSTGDFATVRGDVEAQVLGQMLRVGTLGASSRVSIGAEGGVALDGARGDLELKLLRDWRMSASYRFTASPEHDFDRAGAVAAVNETHHGSLGTSWSVLPVLSLGLVGGAAFDACTDALRGYVGPEVTWTPAPDLAVLAILRGVHAGWFEELGTWPGRSAWVGTTLAFDAIQWTTRVSYFDAEASSDAFREAGLFTSVDAPLLPWLSLQGRVYGQQAFPSLAGDRRRIPSTLIADLSIGGSL